MVDIVKLIEPIVLYKRDNLILGGNNFQLSFIFIKQHIFLNPGAFRESTAGQITAGNSTLF